MARILGYARVSTDGQDLSAQTEALKATGADPIFQENISGVRADRPQLRKLMANLRPGDTVSSPSSIAWGVRPGSCWS